MTDLLHRYSQAVSHRLCRTIPVPPFYFSFSFITSPEMTDIETAKRNAAVRAVADHFDPSAKYVGIGSGSTIVYVVEAIQALKDDRTAHIQFVPTGYQSRQVIIKAGLKDIKFDSLPKETLIDVAFDGADEVDDELNCIKGGGACLYQEKLVATHARKFICVAGNSPRFPYPPSLTENQSKPLSLALRLPQIATPPLNQLAYNSHRSRTPRRPNRSNCPSRPRLRNSHPPYQPTPKSWPCEN